MTDTQEKILKLKKARGALILAHYYQSLEIQDVADLVGDSFALAQKAAKAHEQTLIVCGVRFMAESAKILSPEKTVYLPAENAGCPMADMIRASDVLELRAKYPGAAVVCYVNSSAAVKAVSDICCTSSSAEAVVRSRPEKQIIFVPDRNLGAYVAKSFPEKEFILFDGCCPIHDAVRKSDLDSAREKFPDAAALVHPECRAQVCENADFVGSTAGILAQAKTSAAPALIIGTENTIVSRLMRDLPGKKIVPIRDGFVCVNMRKTLPEDVLDCLEGRRAPLTLPPELLSAAAKSLEAMVAVGN
ncbi:MAG: quinolinate synthase NadA [Oscillospiraceae bacterium]|jgi:quinolinate synthase|nr:quinolinate synthase NadA [Oscillospiraceae bacterium]